MKTIEIKVKEYSEHHGYADCVFHDDFTARWLGSTERTVRAFLAEGDYSEGGTERYVEVYIAGKLHGIYDAPQIRRFRRQTARVMV
jgi:hypothetical protein